MTQRDRFEAWEAAVLTAFRLAREGQGGCDTAHGACHACLSTLARQLQRVVTSVNEAETRRLLAMEVER
jgi:hypothetical protein